MSETRIHDWRAMTPTDLDRVERIGEHVHPDYPEDESVFAERLHLYPSGCLVLQVDCSILGYAISHPWVLEQPPRLNSHLGQLPAVTDTYFIHDVALMPVARGTGQGRAIVERLAEQARLNRAASMSLVAVHGSGAFWRHHGFHEADNPPIRAKLLLYGPAARFMVRRLA
jgi:GNAT superfamily N-acetyltransferase